MNKHCALLFLTVIPSPYQQQLFRALAEDGSIDISVFYYVATESNRLWKPPVLASHERVLPGRTFHFLGPSAHFNPGVIGELRRHRHSLVVVSDYSALTAQLAMWYLTLTGRPWVFWGEMPGMREGLSRKLLRSMLMLPIRLGASAVCAIGEVAVARYRKVLGDHKKIFNIPYFCDLAPFKANRTARNARVTLLYSGQFIERKGLDVLLDAFVNVADDIPELDLLLVGGSEDSPYLKVIPERLRGRVRAAGFFQNHELPAIYAQADIFVLPSRHDGWGVVVNEALGAGLPIIVSDRVGAARDLVRQGENGYVFESENVAQLAGYIRQLAASSELRKAYGRISAEQAEKFGLDEGVRRWKNVCEQLQERPVR